MCSCEGYRAASPFRDAPGMVDHVRHLLVGRQLLSGNASRGIGIVGAQVGPPRAFQSFLEGPGIERA
jgi:hypothetical protein